MGCDVSTMMSKVASKKDKDEAGHLQIDKKILVLGLEDAGKTSIFMQIKTQQFIKSVPTVGLNIEQIKFRSYMITMWDVGGQATKLWKHYFDQIDAIIFVIDSTSSDRILAKASNELIKLSNDPALDKVPILILLNKQDLKDEEPCRLQSKEYILEKLCLDKLTSQKRKIIVCLCSAKT